MALFTNSDVNQAVDVPGLSSLARQLYLLRRRRIGALMTDAMRNDALTASLIRSGSVRRVLSENPEKIAKPEIADTSEPVWSPAVEQAWPYFGVSLNWRSWSMKVILLMALTVDGMIARDSDHFPDWTGREDKRMFKEMTIKAGVLIMGSKTYDAIGRPLPGRKNVVMSRNKRRISQQKDLVFTDKPPREVLADLRQEGFEVAILAGGSQINTIFAREDLIDEICLTYVPQIFGKGLTLFTDSISMQLELMDFKQLGPGQIFARYRVIREAMA